MKSLFLSFLIVLSFQGVGKSINNDYTTYVCYGLEGQNLILKNGSTRRDATSSFILRLGADELNMESIKGTQYIEHADVSDFTIYQLDASAERADLIISSNVRNFVLECEQD